MEGIRGIGGHENVNPRWLAEMLVRIDAKLDVLSFAVYPNPKEFLGDVEERIAQRKVQYEAELKEMQKFRDNLPPLFGSPGTGEE